MAPFNPNPAQAIFPGEPALNSPLTNPRGAVAPPAPAPHAPSTLGTQRFLISQGYHLNADGVMGPRTQAAMADWHLGAGKRNPQKWNAKYAAAPHAPTGTTSPAHTGGGGGNSGGHGGNADPLPNFDIPQLHYIKPLQYAKSSVAAAYGPQIAELAHQLAATKATAAPNLANIQDWYDNALKELASSGAGETKFFDQTGDQATERTKNLMAAGGGDMAAAMGLLGTNELDQLAASDRQFNTAMRGSTAKAGAEAATQEQARLGGLQSDLAAQLMAAKQAKGSAFNTALQDAWNTYNQQVVANQNAKAQAAMLPLDIQGKREDIAGRHQQYIDEHRSNLQQIMMNELQLKMGRQKTNANGAVPNWANLDPSQRQGLRQDLLKSALGSGATPMQVYNMLGNSMRAYSGGKWNPHDAGCPQSFRDALMQEYVSYWNANHKHAGQYPWSFTPGKAPVRGKLNPKK